MNFVQILAKIDISFLFSEFYTIEPADLLHHFRRLFVQEPTLFGPWDGVFTTVMLNIFGVIVFLRMGWIVVNFFVILKGQLRNDRKRCVKM